MPLWLPHLSDSHVRVPERKPSWTIGLLSLKWVQAEGTLRVMLFMVIEHFKHGDAKPIGERFKRSGRMLPEGATYQASWVDSKGTRCFQLMEAPHPELLSTLGQPLVCWFSLKWRSSFPR